MTHILGHFKKSEGITPPRHGVLLPPPSTTYDSLTRKLREEENTVRIKFVNVPKRTVVTEVLHIEIRVEDHHRPRPSTVEQKCSQLIIYKSFRRSTKNLVTSRL